MTARIQPAVAGIQKIGIRSRWRGLAARLMRSVAVGLLPGTLLLAASPGQDPQRPPERAAALTLYRQADRVVAAMDAPGQAPASVRAALNELAGVLGTLAVGPASTGPGSPTGALLPEDLRAALARASAALRTLAGGDDATMAAAPLATSRGSRGVDGRSLRALLDRVRAALDGEVALGLSFQGSYSQSKPKEPVTGGHASAMGPAPAAPVGAVAAHSPVTFEERVQLAARTWSGGPAKDHILESAGNGVALIDFDEDGWLDIYLVTAARLGPARERIAQPNVLYRNRGDWTFEDVSAQAGVGASAWGNGVCAGDADGDGRLDLYVTNWGPNFLFRNRGNGTFEEIAATAGVAGGGWSTGCAFLDADADGDLDLYVARYVQVAWDEVTRARRTLTWRNGPRIMVGPAGLPGESDLFFENLGGGRFREAAAAHGLADPARAYGFGVVATDVDDDGAVDLFVANDSNPNFLYRNLGGGRFESVGLIAGVAVNAEARAQAGMGVDAGDADGDGRMDLVLTAFAYDRNTLYRNLGGTLFEDASAAMGLAATTFERMGWGVAFVDADLDGRLDLFVANGHIFPDVGDHPDLHETYAQKNQLLLNTGATFVDASAAAGSGLDVTKVSRGLAVGDLDNDGDLDVVVSNVDDTPTVLENRQRTGHHWIGVRVSAPAGNRFAIGARVTVTAAGRSQVREIRSGGSFLSQNDLRAFVGLGAHDGPVAVDVRMPGGDRWRWPALAADRLHVLVLSPDARVPAPGKTR